jgi:hypothetical protein
MTEAAEDFARAPQLDPRRSSPTTARGNHDTVGVNHPSNTVTHHTRKSLVSSNGNLA